MAVEKKKITLVKGPAQAQELAPDMPATTPGGEVIPAGEPGNDDDEPKKAPKKSAAIAEIEEWLEAKYLFVFDAVKNIPLFKDAITANSPLERMDDYRFNSIYLEMKREGYKVSKDDLKTLLMSEFSTRVNFIDQYFKHLRPDSGNHIQALANTITTGDNDRWYKYLRKWLIATVANAITPVGCQNHTMLVLTGGQGKGKTTWLNALCPKDLSDYYYVGGVDPANKDSLTLLAEFFLINIDDQLQTINNKEVGEIKKMITLPVVEYRRAYGTFIARYPRIASVCGSVNEPQFLTDPTGNRRFLPFDVLHIDHEARAKIDINKVWAQAYAAFKAGELYWFSPQEVDELEAYNSKFKVQSQEIEALAMLWRAPRPDDNAMTIEFVPVVRMMQDIEARFNFRHLTAKRVGAAAKQLGMPFVQRNVNGQRPWGYMGVKLDPSETNLMGAQTNNLP